MNIRSCDNTVLVHTHVDTYTCRYMYMYIPEFMHGNAEH